MQKYRWVSKTVADGWLTRYRKEMSAEEFNKWKENFDSDTIVYVDVDNVQFLTRDYIKSKLHAEEVYGKN
jgi:hypothetical protein|tara:strand:+ start:1034 stop:1243 length:210 start_codon:yes stop_codon:yes gene_type:complete